jgi:hypothetical protein
MLKQLNCYFCSVYLPSVQCRVRCGLKHFDIYLLLRGYFHYVQA